MDGQIPFEYGRNLNVNVENFESGKKKFRIKKISEYVWTGP